MRVRVKQKNNKRKMIVGLCIIVLALIPFININEGSQEPSKNKKDISQVSKDEKKKKELIEVEQEKEDKSKDKVDKSKKVSKDNQELVTTLTKEEQNAIKEKNIAEEKIILNDGKQIIYSDEYDVYMPVIETSETNKKEQIENLHANAITYHGFNEGKSGNFDVFAHHSQYAGQYFTSFVDQLKEGDEVYILSQEENNTYKYTYKITKNFVANMYDTENVYKQTKKPTITIGTCEKYYKTDYRIIWQGEQIKKEKL